MPGLRPTDAIGAALNHAYQTDTPVVSAGIIAAMAALHRIGPA